MSTIKIKPTRNTLERFLGLFTEVRAGEGLTALLLTLNLFLILTAYYILKPVREALILAGGGAEVKSYAAAGQAILLLGAVPFYATLASRFPRRRLINTVTLFFVGCLVLFYIFAQFQIPLGVVFFLWMGIFNLMVIAQIWSFANDLYTPEAGKRLFAIVAFGASSGAVFGSFIAGRLIGPVGVYQLLLLGAGILVLSLLITNIVDTREQCQPKENIQIAGRSSLQAEIGEPLSKEGAFQLVLQNKYLLLIAVLMLFLNWVNTTGEYVLSKTVAIAADNAIATETSGGLSKGEYIGKFYSNFFTVVNLTGLLMQLFLVSRILKYLGVQAAILFLPVIALAGYALLAFYPVLTVVRWAKTAENATDYSLQNTVRNVLFLPTKREEKYKAKQATDTFFVRAGDVLSAALVYVGNQWLHLGAQQFALMNLGLVLVWLILAVIIGQKNRKLTEQVISPVPSPSATQ
jgi:AAA family ATP:ADP antiporter